jgi:hypothetical protein
LVLHMPGKTNWSYNCVIKWIKYFP